VNVIMLEIEAPACKIQRLTVF